MVKKARPHIIKCNSIPMFFQNVTSLISKLKYVKKIRPLQTLYAS